MYKPINNPMKRIIVTVLLLLVAVMLIAQTPVKIKVTSVQLASYNPYTGLASDWSNPVSIEMRVVVSTESITISRTMVEDPTIYRITQFLGKEDSDKGYTELYLMVSKSFTLCRAGVVYDIKKGLYYVTINENNVITRLIGKSY